MSEDMDDHVGTASGVAVVGAGGRMGSTVCDAVEGADDLELVARLGPDDDGAALAASRARVAVEFTVPAASEANVHALLDAGLHVVVGTTGWTPEALDRVRDHLQQANSGQGREQLGVLVAPNFALSAVLAMHFAERAARYFESVEVVELHHPNKVDAPSGTPATTPRRVAPARNDAGLGATPDATTSELLGARGAVVDGVHVHAVRLRGLVAHQEILLGNPGEQLTIRTDSVDRSSFMPGVLLAVREVATRPGLTVGLDQVLDLS